MNVLLITIFISLILVLFFICFFYYNYKKSNGFSRFEMDSLMPLRQDENTIDSDKRSHLEEGSQDV